MKLKYILFVFCFSMLFFSCSEDNDVTTPRNLQEYFDENSNKEKDFVVACAANSPANTALNYIFYYPEIGATDIRYYETADTSADETDYKNYILENI